MKLKDYKDKNKIFKKFSIKFLIGEQRKKQGQKRQVR